MRVDTLLSRPDTTKLDTLRRSPTARTPPEDTIKAPLARAELPTLTDIGGDYRWERSSFFATGALTLLDLLERVPGVAGLRAAWIVSPQTASYLGDVSRVRVFYDGVELEALDRSAGGIEDLSTIPLWTLEEVRVERGADELRVHVRSWRVERTSAYTRTDVATGSEETNLYRAFFGRRFAHGEAVQVAAQQYSSRSARVGTSGDQLTLFVRSGVARDAGSLDGLLIRETPTRDPLFNPTTQYTIPAIDATRTIAYLRAARGDPDTGGWVQLIGSTQGLRTGAPAAGGPAPGNPPQRRGSRPQWMAMGGVTLGTLRLSAVARYRSAPDVTVTPVVGGPARGSFAPAPTVGSRMAFAPSARLAWSPGVVATSAFAERTPNDSTTRLEASARIAPLAFLAFSATVSRRQRTAPGGEHNSTQSMRAEAGVRLARLWLSGGVLTRDSTILPPPLVYDANYVAVASPRATGRFAALRGALIGPFSADITGIRWADAGFYRPQYQARTEISLASSWLSRFPSGNFHISAVLLHEYRATTYAPTAAGPLSAGDSRVVSSLVEVRIVSATLSWQYRNISGYPYQTVPGYELPRQLSLYGVRWDFWN